MLSTHIIGDRRTRSALMPDAVRQITLVVTPVPLRIVTFTQVFTTDAVWTGIDLAANVYRTLSTWHCSDTYRLYQDSTSRIDCACVAYYSPVGTR